MNCRDFENTIDELAHGALMEAAARESALAHGGNCPRCAARLSDERALSAGLQTLSSRTRVVEAPARVEAALLAALHERTAGTVAAHASVAREMKTGAPQVVTLRQWSWIKTLGTAAATALAAAAAVLLMTLLPSGTRSPQTVPANEAAQTRLMFGETPESGSVPTVATLQPPTIAGSNPTIEGERFAGNQQSSRGQGQRHVTNRVQALPAVYRGHPQSDGGLSASTLSDTTNEAAEIATDFIPLGHASRLMDGDSGQVVRVELPRSALVRFGLPMNVEHAGERVKADVLMGDDGIARAIRFVR